MLTNNFAIGSLSKSQRIRDMSLVRKPTEPRKQVHHPGIEQHPT